MSKSAYEGERGADLTLREVWQILDTYDESLRAPVKEFWRAYQDEYKGNLKDIAQAFVDQMNKTSSEIKVDFDAIINRDYAWEEGHEAGSTWCQKNDAPVSTMLRDIPRPPKDFPKEFAEAYLDGAKAAWEADFGPLSWCEQARTVLVDEKGNASITEAIVGDIWNSGWDDRLHDELQGLEEGKYLVEFLGADSGGSDAIKNVKIDKIGTSRSLIRALKKLSNHLNWVREGAIKSSGDFEPKDKDFDVLNVNQSADGLWEVVYDIPVSAVKSSIDFSSCRACLEEGLEPVDVSGDENETVVVFQSTEVLSERVAPDTLKLESKIARSRSSSMNPINALKKLANELKKASKKLKTQIFIDDQELNLSAYVSFSSFPEQQSAELQVEDIEISVPETGEVVYRFDTLEEAESILSLMDTDRVRELAEDLLTHDPRVDYEMERRKERRHGLASDLKKLATKSVKVSGDLREVTITVDAKGKPEVWTVGLGVEDFGYEEPNPQYDAEWARCEDGREMRGPEFHDYLADLGYEYGEPYREVAEKEDSSWAERYRDPYQITVEKMKKHRPGIREYPIE